MGIQMECSTACGHASHGIFTSEWIGLPAGTEFLDAIKAAQAPHRFLSVSKAGHSATVSTRGHEDRHAIPRSGKEPNYNPAIVEAASREQHCLQIEVAKNVAGQRAAEF